MLIDDVRIVARTLAPAVAREDVDARAVAYDPLLRDRHSWPSFRPFSCPTHS